MTEKQTIREAVAVFDKADALEAAIEDLENAGFDRADISLLASAAAVTEKLGHLYIQAEQLEDDPAVPRVAFVSSESIHEAEGAVVGGLFFVGAVAAAGAVVSSGGTLVAVLGAAAAAGGSGVAIGSVLANAVKRHHAEHLQSQIDHGGLLLWVHLRDAEREQRALGILRQTSAHDVHVHDIPVAN
ncbi:MAG: hypothetical protein HQ495_00610 [Alphaproteobacteria bacterium]|nr:hypothetical protein [Alphaproteobacteria bacterium]